MLFDEERKVLSALLEEWYRAIKEFTRGCDEIFRGKAKQYDQISPVWMRIAYPHGFIQELTKKTDRLKQLLSAYNGDRSVVDWDSVQEELADIVNYSRMFAAINDMLNGRKVEEAQTAHELREARDAIRTSDAP